MEGPDPSDETLMELPIDTGPKRRTAVSASNQPGTKPGPLLAALAVAVLGIVGISVLTAGSPDVDDPADDGSEPPAQPEVLEAFPDATYADLVDGDTVRYQLDALPFSVSTVTVACLRDVEDAESILDECDSGTAHRRTTSPGGVITTDITVRRQITVGRLGAVDCAQRACELRTYADTAAGVVVGQASLGWAAVRAPASGPQLNIETAGALKSGDSFVVTGTGFPAGTSVLVRVCWVGVDPDPFACREAIGADTAETAADGTFRYEGVADWDVGPTGIPCGELDIGLCAVTVPLPGAERQPTALPLAFVDQSREIRRFGGLQVVPAEGLVDGETVSIVPSQSFIDSDFEPFICAAATFPNECTWLDPSEAITDGRYPLPQSFMTWSGTRHDCGADGDCVVSVFRLFDPDTRLDFPITFDPAAGMRPASPIQAEPTTELRDGAALTIVTDGALPSNVLVCAVGTRRTCDPAGIAPSRDGGLVAVVSPTLQTPQGPHSCIDDGPCELVGWDADALTWFEAVPLEFVAG